MAYADFEFYREVYLGELINDEGEFARLSLRASEFLENYTMNRISPAGITEPLRLAVCAMAEVLFRDGKRKSEYDGREIASETNDGYSVSFAEVSEIERDTQTSKKLYEAAYTYLAYTGLMDFEVSR